MFERFTERARQVIVLAQDESRRLNHDYIGTEHILLGLLREEHGLAAMALNSLDITVEEVRAHVVGIVGRGDQAATGQIPFTPRAKKAIERALKEALALRHNYIGTEHLLLALAHEKKGLGARILRDLGADEKQIRETLLPLLPGPSRLTLGGSAEPLRGEQRRTEVGRYVLRGGSAQLSTACPTCGTPLETITVAGGTPSQHTIERRAHATYICPECSDQWTITYHVTWRQPDEQMENEDAGGDRG